MQSHWRKEVTLKSSGYRDEIYGGRKHGTPRCLRFRKACSINFGSQLESILQNDPFPGSSWDRGTFMKYRFKDKLWRIEFWSKQNKNKKDEKVFVLADETRTKQLYLNDTLRPIQATMNKKHNWKLHCPVLLSYSL